MKISNLEPTCIERKKYKTGLTCSCDERRKRCVEKKGTQWSECRLSLSLSFVLIGGSVGLENRQKSLHYVDTPLFNPYFFSAAAVFELCSFHNVFFFLYTFGARFNTHPWFNRLSVVRLKAVDQRSLRYQSTVPVSSEQSALPAFASSVPWKREREKTRKKATFNQTKGGY